jgi:hypothetical protein
MPPLPDHLAGNCPQHDVSAVSWNAAVTALTTLDLQAQQDRPRRLPTRSAGAIAAETSVPPPPPSPAFPPRQDCSAR